jgi:hypothetical protein|eukprot:SAG25_NODE_2784_length_1385_cov_0.985226_2_plen_104_part_00
MADAFDKLTWAMEPSNQHAVQAIARRGQELVRDHLRNEDVKEYWRELLLAYAAISRWYAVQAPAPLISASSPRLAPPNVLSPNAFSPAPPQPTPACVCRVSAR